MTRTTRDGSVPQGEMHRLFFAVWPDSAIRAQIAAATQVLKQYPHHRGRWLKPDRYHITLHFLGDFSRMPDALATRACDIAAGVAGRAFALSLDRAGSFRNHSIPWWLGCSNIPAEMSDLWDQLATAMRHCDVAYEAKLPLTPHVTVLRDSDVTLPLVPIPRLIWQVDEFVLIHSRIGAKSQYRLLGRWPLRRDDGLSALKK
jgi:RNA 2',3'-cyclic 3'-phosphodiesterase